MDWLLPRKSSIEISSLETLASNKLSCIFTADFPRKEIRMHYITD